MATQSNVEEKLFDSRRLEKLTVAHRAQSMELALTRNTRWSLSKDAGVTRSISFDAPKPSPPRVSLQTLRRIQRNHSEMREEEPRVDRNDSSNETLGDSLFHRQDEAKLAANDPAIPSTQLATDISDTKDCTLRDSCTLEPSLIPPSSPRPRHSMLRKADPKALQALAELSQRQSREASSTIRLSPRTPSFLARDTKNRRFLFQVGKSATLSPVSNHRRSTPTLTSPSRGLLETINAREEIESQAPTVTFLSRLLFKGSVTPDRNSLHKDGTPEPASPLAEYSRNEWMEKAPHCYLLQLGHILGQSSTPIVDDRKAVIDSSLSTASSITSLGQIQAADLYCATCHTCFQWKKQVSILVVLIFAANCILLSMSVPWIHTSSLLREIFPTWEPSFTRQIEDYKLHIFTRRHVLQYWNASWIPCLGALWDLQRHLEWSCQCGNVSWYPKVEQKWRFAKTALAAATDALHSIRNRNARIHLRRSPTNLYWVDSTQNWTIVVASSLDSDRLSAFMVSAESTNESRDDQFRQEPALKRLQRTLRSDLIRAVSLYERYHLMGLDWEDVGLNFQPLEKEDKKEEMYNDVHFGQAQESVLPLDRRDTPASTVPDDDTGMGMEATCFFASLKETYQCHFRDLNKFCCDMEAPLVARQATPHALSSTARYEATCFLASLKEAGQCYLPYDIEFCCHIDSTEIPTVRKTGMTTLPSLTDQSEGDGFLQVPLIDVVAEFFRNRRQRHKQRRGRNRGRDTG